jgi:PTS system ascorbate-specific IIA component
LDELIQRTRIRVKETAASWEEAIRKAGNILVEAGSIKQEYVERMIAVVKEYGPYIVISPKLALAHASPGEFVLRNDISLITLSSPVHFGSKNDPVSIILCMGCTDQNSHLNRLSKIAELFLRDTLINDLIEANTVEEITTILKG